MSPVVLSTELKEKRGKTPVDNMCSGGSEAMMRESICIKMISEKMTLGENKTARGVIKGITEKIKGALKGIYKG